MKIEDKFINIGNYVLKVSNIRYIKFDCNKLKVKIYIISNKVIKVKFLDSESFQECIDYILSKKDFDNGLILF